MISRNTKGQFYLTHAAICVLVWSLALSTTLGQRSNRKPSTTPSQPAVSSGLSAAAQTAVESALAFLQANQLAEAEVAARKAIAEAPRSPVTHNVLGVVLDRAQKSDQAFTEFKTAIKLDARFVSAHNNLGRWYAERGKTTEAITEFERVLQIDPGHLQSHYNLGSLYATSDNPTKAAEHFAKARAAAPNDPQLALAFLNVAYRANMIAEANAAADFVERTVVNDSQSLFTLATALAQNHQYERAARLYARVNDMVPKTYEVLYNLGIALFNLSLIHI